MMVGLLNASSHVMAQALQTDFSVYPCGKQSAIALQRHLQDLLADRSDVQIVADDRQNQLLVHGNAEVQRLVTDLLRQGARPAPAAKSPDPPNPKATTKAAAPYVRFLPMEPDGWQQFRQLGPLAARIVGPQLIGQRQLFLISLRNQQRLELEYDQQRSGLLVAGPQPAVDQFMILVDSMQQTGGSSSQSTTRVIRIPREIHGKVEQLLKSGVTPASPGSALSTPGSLPALPANDASGQLLQPPRPLPVMEANSGVVPAQFVFQESSPATAGGQDSATAPGAGDNSEDDSQPGAATGGQLGGVEVQTLPDLDVIILRGRDQDLNQLSDIIEQLERISQETQPVVTTYQLQHAQSQAVAELIEQTSPELVGTRQGRVTVTALAKPNALLLIGWGDAVAAMLDLIRQLDTPVDPATQVEVFRLRSATAEDVQQTLTTFFADRQSLGPRITIAVDNRTNSLIVHASPRDLLEVRRIVQEVDSPTSGAVHQARVYQLRHTLAADLARTLQEAIVGAQSGDQSAILELPTLDPSGKQMLQSGTLDNVRITPNVRNNTLVISCPAESLELITELIRQLDSPSARVQIKVFQIENSDAASLIETMRSLLPSQAGDTAGIQLPSGADESSLAPLRFSLEARSNSIIATGSEGDLRIVEALLSKLDQATTQQRKSNVYQLRNSPAVDVANAVNQFLQSKQQIESATPGEGNPFQELESEVVVVPEPIANKLILSATPRYFDEISQLIQKLDEQPPQVMIQVLIAEVALNNADEFGVELGLQDSVLFDRSLLGDLLTTTNTTQKSDNNGIVTATEEIIRSATNVPGFNFNSTQPLGNSGSNQALAGAGAVGGQALSNFAVGRGNDQLGFGGMVLSASSQNVSILIRALQESRRVRILSRPQVRTLDNQPAFIQVGQRVPRIVGSTVNTNGQSNSVTLENVGLILGVTPRISPDGTVVMEIDAEKSNLGPEAEGIPVAVSIDGTVIRSPRIDTTTAQTTVSAADGETIVLGGLITKSSEELHRQVPFLGDIPLLGSLFRYDGVRDRRTELLIILTPNVIRTSTDNERVRQAEIARMHWCAADVHAIQGDVGTLGPSDPNLLEWSATETVYPDLNPRGEPGGPAPVPDELEPATVHEPATVREPVNSRRRTDDRTEVLPPLPRD